MEQHYQEIRGLGGEVIAVSFSKPERVAAFLKPHPLPFPALADPERVAYRSFELGRTTWRDVLGMRVLGRFTAMMLRGWLPQKPQTGDDIFQLGGDFVLDADLRLRYAYRSADPTDRPTPADLLRAMRACIEGERAS